jgi:hypothetical protein
MSKTRITTGLVAVLLVVACSAAADVRPAAAGTRCDANHPLNCKRAAAYWRQQAHRAEAAAAWQRKARRAEVSRVLAETRGRQPFAYAAKLAYMACRSFSAYPSRCRPPSEMLSVGRCESGLQVSDPNPSSTADGWMQFLSGTWNNTTAGRLGFSRYDVIAMGIATAGIVHHDGSWRQWVCQP